MRSRSRGVKAFIIAYALLGSTLILGGLPYLFLAAAAHNPPFWWLLPHLCFILMGTVLCSAAYGMYKAQPWAWWVWLGISMAGVAIAIIIHVMIFLWFPIPVGIVPAPVFLRFFIRPELGMALVVLSASIVSIWYANRPHVKRYFGVA